MGNKLNVGEVYLNTSNNLYYKVVDVADTGHVTFYTYSDRSLGEDVTKTVWSPFDLDAEGRFFVLIEKSPKFNVGDTVYLLPGAHGSEWTVGRTPENLLDYIDENGMTFTSAWTVYGEADSDGDVRLEQDDNVVYVQEEFLLKEKPVVKLDYSGVGEFVRDAV